jgi:hypothetical protein
MTPRTYIRYPIIKLTIFGELISDFLLGSTPADTLPKAKDDVDGPISSAIVDLESGFLLKTMGDVYTLDVLVTDMDTLGWPFTKKSSLDFGCTLLSCNADVQGGEVFFAFRKQAVLDEV